MYTECYIFPYIILIIVLVILSIRTEKSDSFIVAVPTIGSEIHNECYSGTDSNCSYYQGIHLY